MKTVNQLAEETYPGDTFDTALPQDWVNAMRERGLDVRGNFVTLYPFVGVPYMARITDQGIRIAAVVASTVR